MDTPIRSLLLYPLEEKRRLGHLHEVTVAEYQANIDRAPAIPVFETGQERTVVNGYHRFEAATRLGRTHIRADVQPGTRQNALRYVDLHGATQ